MNPSKSPVETDPQLYGSLIREISIIFQQFSTLANQVLKPLNLNFSQLSLLSHLVGLQAPVGISELADQMDMNQPAVTKMVQHLSEQGWIELQAASEDARKKQVQLNEQGRAVFLQAQVWLLPLLKQSFEGLTVEEAQNALTFLQKVRSRF